jgi:hypothetical protein
MNFVKRIDHQCVLNEQKALHSFFNTDYSLSSPHLKKVDSIYIQQQGHLIDKHTKVSNVEATFSKDFINSSPCPFQDLALLLTHTHEIKDAWPS